MTTSADVSSTAHEHRSWLTLILGVAVAGGAGWVVDTALLWFLDIGLGVPTAIAAAVGFLAAGAVNYLLNRRVFRAGGAAHRTHATRYLTLFTANLVVVAVAVPLLAHVLASTLSKDAVRLIAAKIVVTGVLLLPNTILYRHWVFVGARIPAGGAPAPNGK